MPDVVLNSCDGQQRERRSDPDRIGEPIEDRVDARDTTAPGHPGPDIGSTLFGKGRPKLRDQQAVGNEEEDGEEDQPEEALGSFDGNLPERVDANDRADQEEEDVEAAEVTA